MDTYPQTHITGGDHISANPSMIRSECWGKNKRKCMFLDEEHHLPCHHTTLVKRHTTDYHTYRQEKFVPQENYKICSSFRQGNN